MIIGHRTTLNDVEQRLVKTVASLRNQDNRKQNIPDRKIGSADSLSLDIQGFGGELAFSKMFNVYPDLYVKVRLSKDDKGDVTWSGLCLDVKSTPREEGDLLVPIWKSSRYVDGYALMTGGFPSYTYRGMIQGEEVFQNRWIRNLGRGDTYVVPQGELKETI